MINTPSELRSRCVVKSPDEFDRNQEAEMKTWRFNSECNLEEKENRKKEMEPQQSTV